MVIDGHSDFLLAMKCQVFQAIKDCPALCGMARTDAPEGGRQSASEDMAQADHKDEPLAAHVRGSNTQGHRMTVGDVKGLVRRPKPVQLEGALEDGLDKAPLPELRFRAC